MNGLGSCRGNALEGFAETGFEFRKGNRIKVGAQNYDEVEAGGEFSLMFSKKVANKAFAVISLNGVTDAPTGNDAEAGCRVAVSVMLEVLHNKKPAVDSSTTTADLLKIALGAQPLLRRNSHGEDPRPSLKQRGDGDPWRGGQRVPCGRHG